MLVQINHAIPTSDGGVCYQYDNSVKRLPEGVTRRRNGESRPFSVEVEDGRGMPLGSLTRNGYTFVENFPTTIDLQEHGLDSHRIADSYYPEISGLVSDALGGRPTVKKVIVFDHTIRSRVRKSRREKETNGENIGGYAMGAHNDNTSRSAKNRVRSLSKGKETGGSLTLARPPVTEEDAERIVSGRFGIFNVWRHFRTDYPVLDYPLAVLDAQSIQPQDCVRCQYIYPDRVGEVVSMLRSTRHRWIYYPHMCHHEALVFKVFDSAAELGAATPEECPPHTAHSSFRIPESLASTPARESIECRVLVEFGDTM